MNRRFWIYDWRLAIGDCRRERGSLGREQIIRAVRPAALQNTLTPADHLVQSPALKLSNRSPSPGGEGGRLTISCPEVRP